MNKKEVLINAQKSGTTVKVNYKTGSQPNHAREIIPIKIGHNQVFAKCLNSNKKKSLYICKLNLLTNQQYDNLAKWNPDFVPVTDYEIHETHRKQRYKLFRYSSGVFIIVLLVLSVYITFMSKTF